MGKLKGFTIPLKVSMSVCKSDKKETFKIGDLKVTTRINRLSKFMAFMRISARMLIFAFKQLIGDSA